MFMYEMYSRPKEERELFTRREMVRMKREREKGWVNNDHQQQQFVTNSFSFLCVYFLITFILSFHIFDSDCQGWNIQ